MDSTDRITLFNIFFVHLLDGIALGRLECRANFAIILHEAITTDVFFFARLGCGGTFLWRHLFDLDVEMIFVTGSDKR